MNFMQVIRSSSKVVNLGSRRLSCGILVNYINPHVNFKPSKATFRPVQQFIRSFRQKRQNASESTMGLRLLFRPFLFTITGCTTCFVGAAIAQYEGLRKVVKDLKNSENSFYASSPVKFGALRNQISRYWSNLTGGEKVIISIVLLNGIIFMLWRIPAMNVFMSRFFLANPFAEARCLPMLLSTFSHHSAFHLFCNMYVLWSFSPAILSIFGKEQFLALYLSAGLISNMGSYLMKVLRSAQIPSLGASGCILAILGAVCTYYPESRLSIIFIDQLFPHSFSAQQGLLGIIMLDMCGILFRWKLFDHAAHLFGVCFGVWYVSYGNKLIWKNRESMMKKWHDVRGKP